MDESICWNLRLKPRLRICPIFGTFSTTKDSIIWARVILSLWDWDFAWSISYTENLENSKNFETLEDSSFSREYRDQLSFWSTMSRSRRSLVMIFSNRRQIVVSNSNWPIRREFIFATRSECHQTVDILERHFTLLFKHCCSFKSTQLLLLL